MRSKASFVRLSQWEHWPTLAYYLPLLPFFMWRSLRAGHPVHYLTTNPGLLFSGNGTESKYHTLSLVPEAYIPKSLLIPAKRDNLTELSRIKDRGIEFPLIAKPDIGFRGYLVRKLENEGQLLKYLEHLHEDVIVQEFIPYMNEFGVFYHRMPGEAKGKITSLTIKRFLRVTGDGKSSLKDLILADERAFLYQDLFRIVHKERMGQVPAEGEQVTLSVIGNHSKGTQFLNGNHLISEQLTELMDSICNRMEGWYYGRLDIKYESLELLLQGASFKILEVNGIISEPTHIYDAGHQGASFINALRSINRHWEIMGRIALANHRERGIPYPKVIPYLQNMFWLRNHTKKLKRLNAMDF